MANIRVENVDIGSVVLEGAAFRDEVLTFVGAGTLVEGTILARDAVSLKLVPFVKGGATNQNGVAKALLTYDVTATGAGDVPIRAAVEGQFRKERLIIAVDGTGANVDNAVLDGLRDYGLTPVDVKQLATLDNQ